MAHRTSAAALHAARVVLRNFELTPIPSERLSSGAVPGLTSSEAHVAIVIDKLSNVYELAELRPELRYWQKRMFMGTATAPQVMGFFKRCLEKYSLVPRSSEPEYVELEMPKALRHDPLPKGFDLGNQRQRLTKAASEATRGLFHYYVIKSKRPGMSDVGMDRLQVSELIETALGMSRVEPGRGLLEACSRALSEGKASAADVKKCLRSLGIILEYLPNYEDREEESKLLV